jgi:carbonic anhydrase
MKVRLLLLALSLCTVHALANEAAHGAAPAKKVAGAHAATATATAPAAHAAPAAHGAPAAPAGHGAPAAHGAPPAGPTPDEALHKLVLGNQRFTNATQAHPHQTFERREELAGSQSPYAIIVSCSDSRVPPEVIFDQGLGDLFVVRTAGEVVTDVELGSIEYAVEHLGSSLILVLGHERCGAVKATVAGGAAPGSIGAICRLIQPAVDKAKGQEGDVVENSIRNNVTNVAEKIGTSPIVKAAVAAGRVRVMRGYYDLDDGTVRPVF